MHKPEEMILVLSDLQPGLRTRTFNHEVFRERFQMAIAATLRLYDLHRADRDIPKLWVAAAGDWVEGEPYTGRLSPDEQDTKDNTVLDILGQKRLIQDVAAEGLRELAGVFKEVEFVGVYGNHGANRGKFASKRSNDDTEVYLNLADRLAGVQNIRWQVETDSFYRVFTVAGHSFLLVHGHQISMYNQEPIYGIKRMVALWHQTIPEKFETVLMGHFHSINLINAYGTPVYMNGAFIDDDEYTMEKGLKPTAQQWLLGVHPTYGVTWERRIWLTRAPEREPVIPTGRHEFYCADCADQILCSCTDTVHGLCVRCAGG